MKWVNIAIMVICTMIIVLFMYTAMAKLLDYENFQFGLSESPLIAPFAGLLSWMVPAIEIIISFMLMINLTRIAGLYSSFVLLFLFTVYIASMLITGAEMPCSCGGIVQELSWPAHIVFNSAYMLLAATGIVLTKRKRRRTIFQPVVTS